MRRAFWVVFVFSVFLLVPSRAYALDLGSFDDGLSDFFAEDVPSVSPNDNAFVLFASNDSNESSALAFISPIITRCSTVPYQFSSGSYNLPFYQFVRQLLNGSISTYPSNSLILRAVALVFVWWGVRKTVRMFMAAWRKGRASV